MLEHRETVQRKGRSSELATGLAVLRHFYKLRTKQACVKGQAFLVKKAGVRVTSPFCLVACQLPHCLCSGGKMEVLLIITTLRRSFSSQILINCACGTVVSTSGRVQVVRREIRSPISSFSEGSGRVVTFSRLVYLAFILTTWP